MSTLRLSDLVGGELKIQKEVKLTSGPVSVKIWLPRDSAKTLDAAKSLVQYEMGARHVKHLVIATDADETIIAATSRVRSDSQYLREISGSCTMIRDLLQEYTGRVDLGVITARSAVDNDHAGLVAFCKQFLGVDPYVYMRSKEDDIEQDEHRWSSERSKSTYKTRNTRDLVNRVCEKNPGLQPSEVLVLRMGNLVSDWADPEWCEDPVFCKSYISDKNDKARVGIAINSESGAREVLLQVGDIDSREQGMSVTFIESRPSVHHTDGLRHQPSLSTLSGGSTCACVNGGS